jgi:hypothetical protein
MVCSPTDLPRRVVGSLEMISSLIRAKLPGGVSVMMKGRQ